MKRILVRLSLLVLVWATAPTVWAAQTWVVGPGGQPASLADALRLARDGDTISLLPGTYAGEGGVILQKRLTLQGQSNAQGDKPVLQGQGTRVAEGKALLVVRDGEVTIDNIAFRGARAVDGNGAGIRFERGQLTVRGCSFIDNQMGLLTANFPEAELVIESSDFSRAPPGASGSGLHHLLYVGKIASLQVRGSRFQQGAWGHLIKSRARRSLVAYNLIDDGPMGTASYELEFPNGGEATVVGNVISQGPNGQNSAVLAYGAEGAKEGSWPRNVLRLSHNTFVNQRSVPAIFLRVWADRLSPEAQVQAINNLLVGGGVFALTTKGQFDGNATVWLASLNDVTTLDFRLKPGSLHRRGSVNPGALDPALAPTAQFRLPAGTAPLRPPAQWSPGAFQD